MLPEGGLCRLLQDNGGCCVFGEIATDVQRQGRQSCTSVEYVACCSLAVSVHTSDRVSWGQSIAAVSY